MRVDNDGEGGILALMSLLGVKRQHRPVIIAFGLFGAALIYGDGAITRLEPERCGSPRYWQ
jgi:KUP system potassium uptake protein